jgi:hypothetical protein
MDTRTRDEIAALRAELARLNGHRFVRVHNSVPRLLLFQLGRGVAFGLGTVLGAGAVVSVLAWSVSQIDWIPVIGDMAVQLMDAIQPEALDGLGADAPADAGE